MKRDIRAKNRVRREEKFVAMLLTGLMTSAVDAAERGRVPDSLVRIGIRRLLHQRLSKNSSDSTEVSQEKLRGFIEMCRNSAIAEVPHRANEQHYEVPAQFFTHCLGPRLKYSCCHWGNGSTTLAQAEESALTITCQRAGIKNGMDILELGCGWGSLSLWMAEKYPNSRILGVSNSYNQRKFIQTRAEERGLKNLRIVTADMNAFSTPERFDRVVSVEMFEHMRNHSQLLNRISGWLKTEGKLFVHLFCHREQAYLYEDNGPQDWMTRYFFSGGMMPCDSLMLHYQEDLSLIDHWRWGGQHYEQTCNAWLELTDQRREVILPLLADAYGEANAQLWLQRWRIFFMACAELFGYRNGNEWWVSHYLFEKQG